MNASFWPGTVEPQPPQSKPMQACHGLLAYVTPVTILSWCRDQWTVLARVPIHDGKTTRGPYGLGCRSGVKLKTVHPSTSQQSPHLQVESEDNDPSRRKEKFLESQSALQKSPAWSTRGFPSRKRGPQGEKPWKSCSLCQMVACSSLPRDGLFSRPWIIAGQPVAWPNLNKLRL